MLERQSDLRLCAHAGDQPVRSRNDLIVGVLILEIVFRQGGKFRPVPVGQNLPEPSSSAASTINAGASGVPASR